MREGISIVICCYNSSKLLPKTLKYISLQKIPSEIPIEVIIVDNLSTDNTSEIAMGIWKEYNSTFPLRIVQEPIQGLTAARKKGVESSEFEFILFCDDDNWLQEDYVVRGYGLIQSNDKIGAIGGDSEAVFEVDPPSWFSKWERSYSIGKQGTVAGDITWARGTIWGAGMIVRKDALKKLFSKGFSSLLTDRKGKELSSGGDTELCLALRLAGWQIWYEPSLKLKHYLPSSRLQWSYLRKLHRGFGAQKVDFDPYLKAIEDDCIESGKHFTESWYYQAIKLLYKIRGYGFRKLRIFKTKNTENDDDVLRIEKSLGRLNELLKIRSKYSERIRQIKNAPWRAVFKIDKALTDKK